VRADDDDAPVGADRDVGNLVRLAIGARQPHRAAVAEVAVWFPGRRVGDQTVARDDDGAAAVEGRRHLRIQIRALPHQLAGVGEGAVELTRTRLDEPRREQ
jgi:hypothetical protein